MVATTSFAGAKPWANSGCRDVFLFGGTYFSLSRRGERELALEFGLSWHAGDRLVWQAIVPQRKLDRIQVGAIAQHHDGQLLVRESLDRRAEPSRTTLVPHAGPAIIRIQEPAETVRHRLARIEIVVARGGRPARPRAVRELHGCQRRLHFSLCQQGMILQRRIPLGEVLEIRVDAAVAQSCRRGTLVGLHKSITAFGVPEGAILNAVFALAICQRFVHVQGREDTLVQELLERNAGNFRHDQPEDNKTRVAVRPTRPRCEFRFPLPLQEG